MRVSLLLVASTGLQLCQAFVTYSTNSRQGGIIIGNPGFAISSVVLHAKKKRRRRRDPDASQEPDSTASSTSSGELPDFELDDDEEAEASQKKKAISSNPDEITPSMMGNADSPVGSVRDLLTDRSLETKLEFDEAGEDKSLPDLLAMSRSAQQNDASPGKKKSRQEERRAAAIAAQEAEENSILANLPFLQDENGDFSTVKVRAHVSTNSSFDR
jgi:hypothetical protein